MPEEKASGKVLVIGGGSAIDAGVARGGEVIESASREVSSRPDDIPAPCYDGPESRRPKAPWHRPGSRAWFLAMAENAGRGGRSLAETLRQMACGGHRRNMGLRHPGDRKPF